MCAKSAMLSPLKQSRKGKVLNAAEKLFLEQGVRGTTMQAIAAEAGISKVTLYGYFKDKDLVFTAVSELIASRLETAVTEGLTSAGTISERVTKALLDKHLVVYEQVRSSAFSKELFSTKNRVASTLFKNLDSTLEEQIAAALEQSGYSAHNAKSKSRILLGATQGIANQSTTREIMSTDIEAVTFSLLVDSRSQ